MIFHNIFSLQIQIMMFSAYVSGREAEEVEPILDALPNLEQ
jgi:hypothetical protein